MRNVLRVLPFLHGEKCEEATTVLLKLLSDGMDAQEAGRQAGEQAEPNEEEVVVVQCDEHEDDDAGEGEKRAREASEEGEEEAGEAKQRRKKIPAALSSPAQRGCFA